MWINCYKGDSRSVKTRGGYRPLFLLKSESLS